MRKAGNEPMRETGRVSRQQIQLDDLATGHLGPLAAWRLRRRIARDPALTHEFAEICLLRDDLRQFAFQRAFPHITTNRPSARPATWTIGGFTMKRRAVLAATAALSLLTISGAIAARHYLDLTPRASFTDTSGKTWEIRTNLAGTIRLFSREGRPIGQLTTDGGFPGGSDSVIVTYAGRDDTILRGYGKYIIRSKDGTPLGRVEVTPRSEKEKQSQKNAAESQFRSLTKLYREPNLFTTSDAPGSARVTGSMGLVAGYHTAHGLSWKLLGYASVTAYYVGDRGIKADKQMGKSSVLSVTDLVPPPVRAQRDRFVSLAAPSGSAPQIYWQRAGDDHHISEGTWRDLRRAGRFTGYGKHIVTDESGKPILVLIVSPLPPAK